LSVSSPAPPAAAPPRDTLEARKAAFWERTDYDRAFRGSFGRYMTDVEAAALERVFPPGPADRLLDLGCGHGRFLRWLAPRGRRLVGLDRSWRLLQVATDGLRLEPAPAPTEIVWGSATDLPFESGSVDTITCVRVLQHVPDQGKALAEACRVLRPGGSLVLVQYNVISPHGLIRAFKLPLKAAARAILRATGREPAFDEPTKWTTPGGLRQQLEAAGLVVERATGAWLFPLQYFRSKASNDAWGPFLALALAYEKLADVAPFKYLGGYLIVRCRPR
jgi:ubiquinone/menaquinone biosynthesis C-methylase UbiE